VIKAYKYKYNNKELQDELDLNWYDYGARNYQANLGRFMSMDPLTEKYNFQSPYVYAVNNPIYFVDKDGMAPEDFIILINKKGAGGNGHMAMIYQDKKGNWNYFSQGATNGGKGSISMLSGASVEGGVDNRQLNVTKTVVQRDKKGNPILDKKGNPVTKQVTKPATKSEALKMVGSMYDDGVEFKTTKQEDANIAKGAKQVEADHKSGDSEYNIYTNNCTDAVQDAVQSETNIDLPVDVNPKPNSYFKKLKKNAKKINNTKSTRNKPKKKTELHVIKPML